MAKGFWTGVLFTLAAGGAAAAAYKFCKNRQQEDGAHDNCSCSVCDCDDNCECEENTGYIEEKTEEENYYPSEETKIGVEITVEEETGDETENLTEEDSSDLSGEEQPEEDSQ